MHIQQYIRNIKWALTLLITAKLSNGKYATISVHYDGFISHTGKILVERYNSQARVEELISLGNLSAIAPSVSCPDGHSFENPVDEYCIAYGRDRGEHKQDAKIFEDLIFSISIMRAQYNYYWNGKYWVCGTELAHSEDYLYDRFNPLLSGS